MALGAGIAKAFLEARSLPAGWTLPAPFILIPATSLRRLAPVVGGLVTGRLDDVLRWSAACVSMVDATLHEDNRIWRPTELYLGLERTEKAGASYRAGATLTGIFAEAAFGSLLVHRQWVLPGRKGVQGDYVGWAPATAPMSGWFGVESKGRAHRPDIKTFDKAKRQATSVGLDLALAGYQRASADWAVTSLLTADPGLTIVIDDPPPRELPRASRTRPDEDRALQGHYRTFLALDELVGVVPRVVGGRDAVGAALPGTEVWVGLDRDLVEPVRTARGLRAALEDRAASGAVADDPTALDGHVVEPAIVRE